MTMRRMRNACWIPKATNTHSQYVTLFAFPPQQLLHERAPMLRYTVQYIAGLLNLMTCDSHKAALITRVGICRITNDR